jgi:hypothetical protein
MRRQTHYAPPRQGAPTASVAEQLYLVVGVLKLPFLLQNALLRLSGARCRRCSASSDGLHLRGLAQTKKKKKKKKTHSLTFFFPRLDITANEISQKTGPLYFPIFLIFLGLASVLARYSGGWTIRTGIEGWTTPRGATFATIKLVMSWLRWQV